MREVQPFEIAFRFSSTPQILLAPQDRRIITANPAMTRLLGKSDGVLDDLDLWDVIPASTSRERLQASISRLGAVAVLDIDGPFECQLLCVNESLVSAEVTCIACGAASGSSPTPVADHQSAAPAARLLLQFEKLAASPAAPAQPWAEAASYQYFAKCIGDGFFVLDLEGEVIFANSSAEQILRQPRRQLLGRSLVNIFPELGETVLRVAQQSCRQGGPPQSLQLPVDIRGEIRPFEFGIHPSPDGIGVLFRDVSERVKHEQEIAKLNATLLASQELLRHKNNELNESLEQLAQLNQQLARADQLKSEFLANTSHELRTPLNSIIGFLQLIDEGLCDNREEELNYINNALESAQHLLALINDMLDITRIEAGRMTLLIDDISIDELFQEVYSMTQIQAQQQNLDMRLEIRDESSAWARADFNKAKQILVNLIGNAIKFTDAGRIDVWAEPDSARTDMIRISVADTGIGIPLDRQQDIFEKFIQVDGTSTRKYQGTGLGLAITRNLVEMMGGSISVHSEGLNKGTTMSLTLPLGNPKHAARSATGLDGPDLDNALPAVF